MITDEMKSLLATHVKDMILSGQIGLGGNSSSPLSMSLDVPLTSVSVAKTVEKSSGNVVQAKLEILGSDILGQVIREVGLFNHADANDPTAKLLQRINFEGVGPFNATDRLQLFITMEVE